MEPIPAIADGAASSGASADSAGGETPSAAPPAAAAPAAAPAGGAPADSSAASTSSSGGEGASSGGPTGPGWIVKLEGHHYHNNAKFAKDDIGAEYIRKTLIDSLLHEKVTLPTADRRSTEKVSMRELGISFPVLWFPQKVENVFIENPKGSAPAATTAPPAAGGAPKAAAADTENKISVPQFRFNVQFCWQPRLPSERQKVKDSSTQGQSPATDAAPGTAPSAAPAAAPGVPPAAAPDATPNGAAPTPK
jgi:hypothetical protein